MSERKTHVDLGNCDMLCGRVVFAAPSVTCERCYERVLILIDYVAAAARGYATKKAAVKICERFGLRVECEATDAGRAALDATRDDK